MPAERKLQTAAPAFERRRAVAPKVQRSAAPAPSQGRALQERLGNGATQALARSIQLSSRVSKKTDTAEVEAEGTARKVVRMPEPPAKTAPASATPNPGGVVQCAEAVPAKPAAAPASSGSSIGGGAPLPRPVRSFMEPRFGASFGHVRIHTGESAAQQSAQLSANAFTVGEHVFFGRDKYQPQTDSGRELIAHELTHTIQQGAAVQRSVDPITQHTGPGVQREESDAGFVRNWIADKAQKALPGFRLLTIVLGVNPINGARVDPSAANILRALLETVPIVGALVVQALDKYGIIDKVANWAVARIRAVVGAASEVIGAFGAFLKTIGAGDFLNPGAAYERGKRILLEPISKLLNLGASIVGEVLDFIREAILMPLAALAEDTKGYDLLKAVLKKDPITGAKVDRNATTLIGGFMKLIGEEEIWNNIQKSGAQQRAWAWFQSALQGLMSLVNQIPKLFIDTLKSLDITDLLLPPKAWFKAVKAFGSFALSFIDWAGNAMWTLLEIVFDVVSPGAWSYIQKTGAALKSILKNPIPFVKNLVKAAKLGFDNFADHFVDHLKAGLIDWLVGALPGIYIPKAFSLPEIAKFVFSVLGLTWANIRQKLVKATNETFVQVLETGFDIVVTLVRDGPAAAWDKIQDQLAGLKDMVIGGIIEMIVGMVVKKAIPKLVAMFIPGAGFISAIVSIYDTVMVFVNKLAKIVQVVRSFVDSIVSIANGAIAGAAARVESTLAGLLSLAISFLAGFAGLGNVAEKVMAVIEKVRAPIDKALDKLIGWIVGAAKKFGGLIKAGVASVISWWKKKVSFSAGSESHTLSFQGEGASARLAVASGQARPIEVFLAEKAGTATSKKAKDAIKKIGTLVSDLKRVTATADAKKEKGKDDKKLETQIENLMNQIAASLASLLSESEWGTQANPLPFVYPKRRASAYPTFYLGTGSKKKLGQKAKADEFGKQGSKAPDDDRVYRCRPNEALTLPGEGKSLGLAPGNQVNVGTTIFFKGKSAREGGVGEFKTFVARFGFVASDGGWDVDHVVELQIGGKDGLDNLWPLPAGENRASGSIIKNASVKLPDDDVKTVQEALAAKKKAGLWIMIESVKSS